MALAAVASVQVGLSGGPWPDWAARRSAVARYLSAREGDLPSARRADAPGSSTGSAGPEDASLIARWRDHRAAQVSPESAARGASVLSDLSATLPGGLLSATTADLEAYLDSLAKARPASGTAGRILRILREWEEASRGEICARLMREGLGQGDGAERDRVTSALATRRDLFARIGRGTYRRLESPGKSRSRATRNRHLCAIRRFYAWAAKRYIPRSPAEGLRAVREDLPEEIVWCDRAERDRIVRAADALGHGLPVRIAFWAGLRRGEIGRLRARDVDLDSGWISVGRDRETQTKTRRARRVPVAAALRETLAKALPSARQGPLVRWPPMIRDAAQRVLEDLREELPDLAHKISWNVFRHSFCSLLAQTGRVSIDQISAIAGHTPEVCRRHYAHLIPRDRDATGIDAL